LIGKAREGREQHMAKAAKSTGTGKSGQEKTGQEKAGKEKAGKEKKGNEKAGKGKAGKAGAKAAKALKPNRAMVVVKHPSAQPFRSPPKVLIAGAGVGGLTLALMLHARGVSCRLYEQAGAIREVGAGINALPHAIKELAELGLLPALDAIAVRTSELYYMNRTGQVVWREPRGIAAGFDVPQFSIHRGRLQKVLHDAVIERMGTEAIVTGRKLTGFIQDEGGVTAFFTDSIDGSGSETVRGEVLVGADGIHSVIRGHYHPDVARLCRFPGFHGRAQHDHRRRHERQARALSDRRGPDAGNPPDQLGRQCPDFRHAAPAGQGKLVAPGPP
jgi:hypothetical protein